MITCVTVEATFALESCGPKWIRGARPGLEPIFSAKLRFHPLAAFRFEDYSRAGPAVITAETRCHTLRFWKVGNHGPARENLSCPGIECDDDS